MVVANSDGHRGTSPRSRRPPRCSPRTRPGRRRTRIRKSTGRKAEDIKTALAAGQMSAETRAAAGDLAAQLTLDELALLAEFDGDDEAVATVLEALRRGLHRRVRGGADPAGPRRGRPARAAGRRAGGGRDHGHRRPAGRRCPAGRAGARRCGSHPGGARGLPGPGRVSSSRGTWRTRCTTAPPRPSTGTRVRTFGPPPGGGRRRGRGRRRRPRALPDDPPPADVPPDPGRRLVIEGNKAWAAAAEVRRRWLPQLFARRAAPREVARFVAVAAADHARAAADRPGRRAGQPGVHRRHRAARGPGRRRAATRARRSGCRC